MLTTTSSSFVAMEAEMLGSSSRDTMTVGTITYPGENTLVSAGEQFELGFFSPKGSSNSRRTKIQLTDVRGSSSSTRLAKLLDSGNLVLMEGERILWQRFDYPTDTYLPGMLVGDDFKLTSWASQADLKQGKFTFQRDPEGGYDVILDLSPYWKSEVYGNFIQADQTWDVILFLLSDITASATTASRPAGTNSTLTYNITLPSDYYNNTWLVMNKAAELVGLGELDLTDLPGARLTGFLNSIFTVGSPKKAKIARAPTTETSLACSPASLARNRVLEQHALVTGSKPTSITGKGPAPGRKEVLLGRQTEDRWRHEGDAESHQRRRRATTPRVDDNDEDEDGGGGGDDDAATTREARASSDLFELDNLASIEV
ncbi:hypothetical protein NL676_017559 [Syzygium grande]|nr:hypothetical protein NL676_017559 [Syzygium grande]